MKKRIFKRNIERLNLLANPSNKGEERKGCEEKFFSGKMALQYLDICEGKVILLVHGGHF